MDRQSAYSLSVLGPPRDEEPSPLNHARSQFREFILEFRFDNAFVYRYDAPGSRLPLD